MRKKFETHKQLYIFNMIAFIGFAFEFFIRHDYFFGCIMIFNGLLNFIAFQQAPRRIATITVLLNLFNASVSMVVSYNYVLEDYLSLSTIWIFLSAAYLIASLRQIYSIASYNRHRKRHKKKIS